jgi:carboxylesterase type B
MNTRESRIIETSKGKVKGKTYVFDDGHSASAYLGIPYAKPPVGKLRFKVSLAVVMKQLKPLNLEACSC